VPRPTIVLDCDPGHDDAVAMIVAAAHTDLVAITTVSGNAPLSATSRNALLVAQIAGVDVPVYAGADRPLVEPPRHAPQIHGATGLDGPVLPPLERELAGDDAVARLSALSHAHADLWIVAVGPLTNVALALRSDPGLVGRLAGISIMGGALHTGNASRAAEFNVWADPEAAAIVFDSGVPLRMAGLDLTYQFYVDDHTVATLRAIGSQVAAFVADLFDFYIGAIEARGGRRRAFLHDPCAVLALTHPELFETEDLRVDVELTGSVTRGSTVPDVRHLLDAPEPNVTVLRRVDRAAGMEVVVDAIASRPA
jgi:inosine-uridine nucleoside N-ribohydrolase